MTLDMAVLGRVLLVVGLAIAAAGAFLMFGGRLPLGRLPGDISGSTGNLGFAFPVVTCIVISVVLTVVINLFIRR